MEQFDKIYKSLSSEEQTELSIISDPVRWAEVSLRNPRHPVEPLEWREYQKEAIGFQPTSKVDEKGFRYLANRLKVYRWGRRSGKTVAMSAEALYHAFTKGNFLVLIITPFESQIREIFKNMTLMIKGTYIQPTRHVKKPFIMEFANGSRIIGYTAGASSSVKGSGIRGQSADLIILDEMDHGIDETLQEVVFPIFINNRNCQMLVSSTPSGRHGLFWEMCTNPKKLGAKEFYVPSTKIPGWNSESERLAKVSSKTKTKYQHEYLAEFGSLEEGVFLNKYLEKTMTKYSYEELKYDPRHQYFMGVDWNEVFGVTITILEKRRGLRKVRIWTKDLVERSEYTQVEAVNRIIEWSERMRFTNIYVDRGFGGAQEQWLKKYGSHTMGSNLDQILKGIDYGGVIIVRDPINGVKIKKSTKPFMVDNAVDFVESERLEMPKTEDEKDCLIGAMRGYKVKRFSAKTNDPVYECEEEDHELDALFLALLAITLETTDIASARPHAKFKHVMNVFRPKDVDREMNLTTDDGKEKSLRDVLVAQAPNFRSDKNRKRKRRKLDRPKRSNI